MGLEQMIPNIPSYFEVGPPTDPPKEDNPDDPYDPRYTRPHEVDPEYGQGDKLTPDHRDPGYPVEINPDDISPN